MTTQLLLVDPQNDFCDFGPPALGDDRPMPALPVPGAVADLLRVTGLLERRGEAIDSIVVTLDSHPLVGIERPLFWETDEGGAVEPFTVISADDLRARRYRPAVTRLQGDDRVLNVLAGLEAQGKPGVMVWPAHCVVGTWGHQVFSPLAQAIERWTAQHRRLVHYVHKGSHPLTEHFGAFEAEVVLPDAPETGSNHGLARRLARAGSGEPLRGRQPAPAAPHVPTARAAGGPARRLHEPGPGFRGRGRGLVRRDGAARGPPDDRRPVVRTGAGLVAPRRGSSGGRAPHHFSP